VQLPDRVRRRIEERAEEVGFPALKRAATAMSEAYREGRAGAVAGIPAAQRLAAYLVTRMPATYAAAFHVLREVSERLTEAPRSVLDIGAGTGAASLAARQFFPDATITMMERDSTLAEAAGDWLPDAKRAAADATRLETFPESDLIIAAYSLGEMPGLRVERLWAAARVALVVIEPGTPRGFGLVRKVRDELLAAGAHVAAPCPGDAACPVTGGDWCHFAARVERSSLHRRVKGGELGHEDEKYSYVALTRRAVHRAAARIVRHPQQQPGVITIQACTPAGLRQIRITKRDREAFRAARKAGWGSVWDSPAPAETLPSSPEDDRDS